MSTSKTNTKTKLRTFKVRLNGEAVSKYRGRFTGRNPQQAAKKALTSILSEKKKKTGKYELIMRETTRGSKKKEYAYTGKKVKRKKANKVMFPGSSKPVVYKFDSIVHSNRELSKSLRNKLNTVTTN